MARSHIHHTKWKLPDKFSDPMDTVQEAVKNLKDSVRHDFLKFTLDGRLVGDLGEAIAEHYFNITLHDSQQTGHDATYKKANEIYSVEIKTRKEATNLWFDFVPDYIIAFRIESGYKEITLVYAGPGDVINRIRSGAKAGTPTKTKAGAFIRKISERQGFSLNQLAEHFDYSAFMKKPVIPFRNHPKIAP